MFWFVKTVHEYSAGPESNIYHMSQLFAYMACREGVGGLEVLKCFVRGGQKLFFLLCVCVWVCWSGSVPLLP